MNRAILILILFSGAALAGTAAAAFASTDPDPFYLGPGESLFWDGEYVDPENGHGDPSYTYTLVTAEGGLRMRVALDLVLDYRRCSPSDSLLGRCGHRDATASNMNGSPHPNTATGLRPGRDFLLEVDGDSVHLQSMTAYSIELLVCFSTDPAVCDSFEVNPDLGGLGVVRPGSSAGTWTIRVTPQGDQSQGWFFKLRAKLEDAPAHPPGADPLVPNLRAIPPSELTFCEPVASGGFLVGQTPLCGAASDGLTPDEKAHLIEEHGAEAARWRGVRFDGGPENVGDGALELRGRPRVTDPNIADVRQRIYNQDESYTELPEGSAGTMEYHLTHGHWHYDSMFKYELFNSPVDCSSLPLEPMGDKVGFCPGDERLADWGRFYQDRRFRANAAVCWEDRRNLDPEALYVCPLDGCVSPTRPVMTLSKGWGDFYEWARTEQYLVFPTDASGLPLDGEYVLQSTADSDNKIVESNETDNTSYTHFKVEDGEISIIARGLSPDCATTAIDHPSEEHEAEPQSSPPMKFELGQSHPNPFTPHTHMTLALPVATNWTLGIYSVSGELVQRFEGHVQGPAHVNVDWDGTNLKGKRVAPGVYFYRMIAGKFSATRKTILMR